MREVVQFIVDNELIVLTSLFSVIIVLMIIVLITDAINRRKNKKNAKTLLKDNDNNINNAFKENIEDEDLDFTEDFSQYKDVMVINEEKHDDAPSTSEIKYVEEDIELEKTKAQEELKNLKEELMKMEQKEQIEKIQEVPALEKIEVIDVVDKQEKDAIISLEQFNKLSDKIYELNEVEQYQDDGNEPISIQELEELYKTKEISTEEIKKVSMNTEFNLKEEKQYKFKTSPVISPVYGFGNVEDAVNVSIENTADLDKLSEEIRKTNEFLNMLKELRKNLE